MRKHLVICDEEIRYATRLGENISAMKELDTKVNVCSTLEKAMRVAEQDVIDILLISDRFSSEERGQVKAENVFVLVRGKEWDGLSHEHAIFKYQSVHAILREIMEVYALQTEESSLRRILNETARLIGIYSPIHRVGKTTFAMALGRELSKEKKTLYINLEEYAGLEEMEGVTLGEMLYYMRQGKANLSVRMETVSREESGLYYLAPMKMVSDLREITVKEWNDFLEEIRKHTSFERIILDFGECIQGFYDILELCDHIYMPIQTDVVSERKVSCFHYNVEQLGKGELLQKIEQFEMPIDIVAYAKKKTKEELSWIR